MCKQDSVAMAKEAKQRLHEREKENVTLQQKVRELNDKVGAN